MRKNWKFYGRKPDLQVVGRFVNARTRFSSLAIYGRRYVGKTALLTHFKYNTPRLSNPQKIIFCSLGAPVGLRHRFDSDLRDAIQRTDSSLLDDYIPHEDTHTDVAKIAHHILEKGHILIIDEFQRIRLDESGGLESNFQHLIDDLRIPGCKRPENWQPRLIVMGSEQQRLVEMFKHPMAPMFGRVNHFHHVKPWTFAEFKEMAQDQEWDQNPDRLLTLWTTYNGLPGHWERFWEEDHLSDFVQIRDNAEWTRQFLEMEEVYRTSPSGEFKDQMEVQLKSPDVELIRWLAERPEGRDISDALRRTKKDPSLVLLQSALKSKQPDKPVNNKAIEKYIYDAIDRRLGSAHLGLLNSRAPLDSEDKVKWCVSDNFTRFQIKGLEPFTNIAHVEDGEKDVLEFDRVAAVRSLEGYGLETFAAAGLRHLFEIGTNVLPSGQAGRTRIYIGLEREEVRGDLDILLIHHQRHPTSPTNHDGDRHFWVGSVKRNARAFYQVRKNKHGRPPSTIRNDIERLNAFLRPLSIGDALTKAHFREKWKKAVNYVMISRSFTAEETGALAQEVSNTFTSCRDHGITNTYIMDITDILSGRGPRPLHIPAPHIDRCP